ncbi:peptide ABC transporter permease [Novosphingobium profundi]|nr:peptide ABC transporter permease [Novosphingobium profundi]MBT0670610.1 peptide ABC transporter permease [Novosphingobium profundi]
MAHPIEKTPQEARGGDIVLRKRWQRNTFIAGLCLLIALPFVVFML